MAAMASSSPIPRLLSLPLPSSSKPYYCNSPHPHLHRRARTRVVAVTASLPDDVDVLPARSADPTDQQQPGRMEEEPSAATTTSSQVVDIGGLAFQGGAAAPAAGGGGGGGGSISSEAVDRAINAAIVLAAGTYALTKLLTVDHDYWHGWTIYEILRYAPLHNWTAYEEALRTNPVLAKMMISGVVYSLGDWVAQCYEGKPLFEFDRARMFRSGLVGFTLHGSLSHYYYHLCEALFPFKDWWVVPAKVAFDQTAWSAFWNSVYYVVLGFLRFESPASIFGELRSTFWPMLTAGWKLWPFAHLITYGVIPVEQRLLWVDCVELIWVTILSTYSNEKSEARNSEGASQSLTSQSTASKDNSR